MYSNEEMRNIQKYFSDSECKLDEIAVDSGIPTTSDLEEIEQQYRNFEIERKFNNRKERRKALKLQKRMKRKRK